MGFLAGVVSEINRQEDAKERADRFTKELLERRKNILIPQIAERMAKDKLVALKEKLYLNQSRGAFKKVEQNREEIFRHINYMRKIKEKPNVFLI